MYTLELTTQDLIIRLGNYWCIHGTHEIFWCIIFTRVSHLAEELISHLKMTRNDLNLEPKDILCVKVAGLCHDLG